MLKPDTSQSGEKVPRTRNRHSPSCTECKRRKQKCNQAKDRPCNNCARRYPPVACVYEKRSASRVGETIVEIDAESKLDRRVAAQSRDRSSYAGHTDPQNQLDLVQGSSLADANLRRSDNVLRDEGGTRSPLLPFECSGKHEDNVPCEKCQPSDVRGPFFPYAENCKSFMREIGNSIVEPLYHLPLEPSRRNAELYHIFIHRLSNYMTTIDGQNPSQAFNNWYIPFMVQSRLTTYIPIHTTACFNAIASGIDANKAVEAVASRFKLISLINEHIGDERQGITDEALAVVMSMTLNDLIYADKRSVMAHILGLRSMVRARGGLKNVQFVMLRQMLIRTDYLIAVVYECDPLLDVENMNHIPFFVKYPLHLDNPLLQSKVRFIDLTETLHIAVETAAILDDMRFLTNTILAMRDSPVSEIETTKFLATASWIHKRLSGPGDAHLSEDFTYQSCRTAATIFSSAILSRKPFSESCTSELLLRLWMNQWRVPLTRWKEMPGLYFWLVLTSAPFARDLPMGRWCKSMIGSSTMAIGLVDWNVAVATLRGFLAVQRWLGGGVKGRTLVRVEEEESEAPRKRAASV